MLLSYHSHGDMGCFLSLFGFIISLSGQSSITFSESQRMKVWVWRRANFFKKKHKKKKKLVLEAAVPLIHSLTLFCRSMMWALGDVSTEPAASLLQSYVPQQGTSDRTVTVKPLKAGDKEGKGRGVPLPHPLSVHGTHTIECCKTKPQPGWSWARGQGTTHPPGSRHLFYPQHPVSLFSIGFWLVCSCSLFQETRRCTLPGKQSQRKGRAGPAWP